MMLYKPLQQYMRSSGAIKYQQFTDDIMSWDNGRQGIRELYEIFNLSHFTTASTTSPNPAGTFPDAIFNLDPNLENTGGPLIQGGQNSTKAKMYLKTVKLMNEFVNLSSIPMIVEVRWCAANQNTYRSPLAEWSYQRDLEKYGQVEGNQNFGTGIASPGYPKTEFIGQIPETLKGWSAKWSIIKKENYVLNGGCRVKSFIKLYYNFLADKEAMYSHLHDPGPSLQSVKYLRGLTIIPIITARSVPVLHKKEGQSERMSYGPGKLGWVSNHIYTFVPDALEQKFPYTRVYPSTYNESANAAHNFQVNVDDLVDAMEVAG